MVSRLAFAACAVAAGLLASAPQGFAQQSMPVAPGSALSPAQRAEVIALIRQELVEDPSVLRAAIASLQAQDQASQAQAQSNAIASQQKALTGNAADPEIGNPRARISVVEFYDTRCPYCREMRSELTALAQQDENVRIVFKDIPILGPNSVIEARALLAAQRQGGYAAMQAAIMSDNALPTASDLRATATRLGLNADKLMRDMADPAIAARLAANTALAQYLGINGTPAFVIGSQLVPGAISLDDLQKLVDQAQAG
ncbi:DsbA family protein [Acidisoma sp.]|uniref:DsbA family protein n=1 Tax=Acidisoma sp. TaxID=1872115 RepID=UPI003B001CDD